MTNIRKKVVITSMVLLGLFTLMIPFGKTKFKPYYYGDAVSYNNKAVFGTINLGYFELFTLENNQIVRKSVINAYKDYNFGGDDVFYDFTFNKEGSDLMAYLTNGRFVYKYNVSNQSSPVLVMKMKDNSWNWFYGFKKIGNTIATVGSRGVEIRNNNFDAINNLDFKNSNSYNINIADDGKLFVNVANNKLQIYNVSKRQITNSQNIVIADDHSRKTYIDEVQNDIYIAEDNSVTKYAYDSTFQELVESGNFKHTSTHGYDVVGSDTKDYLYFSDGLGIVKLDKSTMKPLDWVYTTKLGLNDSWSMGLNLVEISGSDKLIVFNNSNILVLDQNLDLVDSYENKQESLTPTESLWIATDIHSAAPGYSVTVSGGGYALGEDVIISFAGQESKIKADNNGRYKIAINVPSVLPGVVDIKSKGVVSGLSYSISFTVR
jgi:hypothetical protein